jgi:23S rRNA C2498 (ribose-2'-O)-methylase RlmM
VIAPDLPRRQGNDCLFTFDWKIRTKVGYYWTWQLARRPLRLIATDAAREARTPSKQPLFRASRLVGWSFSKPSEQARRVCATAIQCATTRLAFRVALLMPECMIAKSLKQMLLAERMAPRYPEIHSQANVWLQVLGERGRCALL